MTTLLIDGDQFLYKGTIACEKEVRWDEVNHVLFSNYEEALENVLRLLGNVTEALGSTKVRLAFTKGDSFRKGLYPAYKGNRVGQRKPMCFERVRDTLEATYQSLSVEGLEADDILGIWATRDSGDYIIVSDDKDLKTIPGKLYRMGELITVSEDTANYHWLFQALIGDTADGFPGCPGIGPKTAEKLLHDALDGLGSMQLTPTTVPYMWPVVVKAYEKAGLTADDALLQARLARILRASDWDSTKKEPILWTP